MAFNYSIAVVTLLFIALDVVTGLAQAVANKELASEKMRQGLFHKLAFIFAITLAYSIDYGMTILDLGFDVHIVVPVCAYLCITEVVSVVENLCKMNPELSNTKFLSFFKMTEDGSED